MTVRVLYFAMLREQKGRADERIPISDGTTVGALYESLFPDGGVVAYTRNQQIVPAATLLNDGDEVGFLPPLGGG